MAPLILFMLACSAIWSPRAEAITWEFDEADNAQGWQARESAGIYTSLLPSEVSDGIWRIPTATLGSNALSAIAIASPLINLESALFDKVSIRFRVVQSSPTTGSVSLGWSHPADLLSPGSGPSSSIFELEKRAPYTTDWQEVVFSDLNTHTAKWEGDLADIRLMFALTQPKADEIPQALEIDQIVLTGVEEQFQGELPPPPANSLGNRGTLFAPAQFIPLGQKGFFGIAGSPLGDLDGDGDLDLVLSWFGRDRSWTRGLIAAVNIGNGEFQPKPLMSAAGKSPSGFYPRPYLAGVGDLNNDGYSDIVYMLSEDVEVLLSDSEAPGNYIQETIAIETSARILRDFDGDGRLDLWITPWSNFSQLQVLLGDGLGVFSQPRPFGINDFSFRAAEDLDGDGLLDATWIPLFTSDLRTIKISLNVGQLQATHTYDLELEEIPDSVDFHSGFIRAVGDCDGDGDVDAILTTAWPNKLDGDVIANWVLSSGLQIALNDGRDYLYPTPWHDAQVQIKTDHSIQAWDFNGDGIPDPVVVNQNPRSPGVMVHLSQKGELPVLEGFYELTGDGEDVWAGDVDNDNDLDLVVIAPDYQGGGLFLLINQSSQITAVEEIGAALPLQSRLGAAYPNPFNPGVVIPFTVRSAAEPVSLAIYNTLGQEVRRMTLGILPAGVHQVEWDGQDEAGQVLSSGVYLYRLQAGPWSAAGKVVKSE